MSAPGGVELDDQRLNSIRQGVLEITCALRLEGLPITDQMVKTQRRVLWIAMEASPT